MGLMPYVRPKYLDDNSVLATGYQLFFYIAGTATKQDTYSDDTLTIANPNPIILNSRGEPDNAGTPIDIYLTPGLSYKVVLATATDTDPPASPVWSVDNVTESGGGSGTGSTGQWLTQVDASYVNASTFSLAGTDLTVDFHKGRRVWLEGGADIYGVIFTSTFAVDTTVSLVDIQDSTGAPAVLNAAMTKAALSLQRVDANNAFHWRFYPGTETGVTNFEFPVGDLRRYGALLDGVDDNAAFVSAVAAAPAGGTIYVSDGVAAINNITLTKEVHIIGTGTLEQISANSDFITFGTGSDNSSIENITIDGNQTPGVQFGSSIVINVSNISITNNTITGGEIGTEITTATAIGANITHNRFHTNRTLNISCSVSASQIKILNNTLEAATEGLRVTACSDVVINDNTVLGFSDGGIRIFEETGAHTNSKDVMISNNYVSNHGTAGPSAKGIDVYSCEYVSIVNNIVDRISSTGIQCDWASVTSSIPLGITISGNTIIESADNGMRIVRINRGIVSNNNVVTNNVSDRGIYTVTTISNTLFTNNNVGQCLVADIDRAGSETNVIWGNNLGYNNIYQSNLNIVSLSGFSTSSTRAENVFALITWPGGVQNSNTYTFPTPEPDTNYELILCLDQTTNLVGANLTVINKTTTGVGLRANALIPLATDEAGLLIVRVPTPHTT